MSRFVILQKAILIPKNTFMRSIRNSGVGKCVYLHAQGWGIDHQERTNLQFSVGVPGGGGGGVGGDHALHPRGTLLFGLYGYEPIH